MKTKIVKLEIKDTDLLSSYECPSGILETFYLIDPDETKLAELKNMIEHRFDYKDMTDEEIEKIEEFCDNIWSNIYDFIKDNFVTLNIDETYEIAY